MSLSFQVQGQRTASCRGLSLKERSRHKLPPSDLYIPGIASNGELVALEAAALVSTVHVRPQRLHAIFLFE